MSLESVFGVGQSALVAQTYRLNVIAENLANAEVAAATSAFARFSAMTLSR